MRLKSISFKLDARSRLLLAVAVALLIPVIYYKNIFSGRQLALNSARERYAALRDERQRLESTIPEVTAEQVKLDALKKEYNGLLDEVTKAERSLPKNVNIPDILNFLVKDKDKFRLKIINIKSYQDKAQDIPLYVPPAESKMKPISYYTALPIEIDAFASFADIIDYIANIEAMLPYQRISALQVDMQKTLGGQPEVFLTVLSILGRGQESDENLQDFQLALQDIEKKIRETEDPFHKKEKPRQEERLAGVELNGIISKKGTPYAIINGASLKVGDSVQNKKIIRIDSDSVVLEEEEKLFKLTTKTQ